MSVAKIKKLRKGVSRRIHLVFQPRAQQVFAAAIALCVVGGMIYSMSHHTIRPSAYRPLLELIAKGESEGNYNAFYGAVANTDNPRLTSMTIAEVMEWQKQYVAQGAASSAVGRYQIIDTTLRSVVRQEAVDHSSRFDEVMQDQLAAALIDRRGIVDYVEGRITREQFAARLSQEWAALPLLDGQDRGQSFYAGDGLNHSRITVDEFQKTLDAVYTLAR